MGLRRMIMFQGIHWICWAVEWFRELDRVLLHIVEYFTLLSDFE